MSNDAISTPAERSRREERLQSILAAAFDEFAANGFAAAKLNSIAERAGIGKGTIYLYFQSKEQLFEEVMKTYISPVIDQVVSLSSEPHGSASAMLRSQIETIYTRVIATERRRMMRLLVAEGPRFPHLVDLYFREVLSRVFGALKRTVEYGLSTGEFSNARLLAFPPLVMGPALGGAMWKILFDERYPLDLHELCTAHVDMLLSSLRAPQAPDSTANE